MNQKSLEKIEAAAPFLLWFRDTLSPPMQQLVRPYLAQPYQSALKVLDYCSDRQPTSVDAIASLANLNKETTRQILKSLKAGGLELESVRGWQRLTPTTTGIPAETDSISNPAFKEAVDQSFRQLY